MKSKAFVTVGVICAIFGVLFLSSCTGSRKGKPHILVFSKTAGYHHKSIANGNKAMIRLGAENGFQIDTTTNPAYFVDDSLQKYAAVVFLSTSGNVFDHRQEAAFERYIQAGGGFVGIHGASTTEYNWGWYGRLVGGYFSTHPPVQEAVVQVADHNHPSTQHLPAQWERSDEWYDFKWVKEGLNILLHVDEQTYGGGITGNPHPIAWYQEYDGGRAFYTALGHTEESYDDSLFMQHILGGIRYAIKDNAPLDYSKVSTQNVPEDERIVKTVLTKGTLYEPTEMAILPNLDVLIGQRRGEILLYDSEAAEIKQAGVLDVYSTSKSGANIEEGLLGIAVDPDFENNRHVFVFYSPGDTAVNRLSRFELQNDTLVHSSEKIVLEFYSQREICCHTGGSIAFGPEGLLYVSTGDNTTPFNEEGQPYVHNGFAPLDDRPGHENYDAGRSAGNSDDLRGKILRIKIKEDGSYQIPEGNLFSQEEDKARPEIYVMGSRNPYRIAVDQKTGFLYWGEVGPDANRDSLETRGPRGYDEINQAKEAGFFGWPLFVGNNFPYNRYNYVTGETGKFFDPAHPINDSRNNTGLVKLPPAQPALIWYPYEQSKDFPELGAGGRTAMAGPVYYPELYPEKNRYPEYFRGKFFFYDWIRNWIKLATFSSDGGLDKIEPFADHLSFAAPVDMEVGPDGRIYILEYGQGWYTKNPDAGLSRIDYIAGNLPPRIQQLEVDKGSGNLPLTITAVIEATDEEHDALTYIWNFGDEEVKTTEKKVHHTFTKEGEHTIKVKVTDTEGGSAKSEELSVYAGNEAPSVKIQLEGNKSFYSSGQEVQYQVQVIDKGDEVAMENLYVSVDYLEGRDLAGASKGHQQASAITMGKNLMETLDCKGCHKISEPSIGPSYEKVAAHYDGQPEALNYLRNKIINGGSGVWGENQMPAHPSLKTDDAADIVKWILSLSDEKSHQASLPAQGKIVPNPKSSSTIFHLSATYTDNGKAGVKPLSGTDEVFLKSSLVHINKFSEVKGFENKDTLGTNYLEFPHESGWIKLASIDMAGIEGINLEGYGTGKEGRFLVEVIQGTSEGKKLGETVWVVPAGVGKIAHQVRIDNNDAEKMGDVYIRVKPLSVNGKALLGAVHFILE